MSNGTDHVVASLLDVGPREYGDAMLLQFGATSVMVDGAHRGRQNGDAEHPSIPDQLGRLLDQSEPPYTVDLLIVSHAHQDHVGCLPHLIRNGILRCRWALMPHPAAAFGRALNEASPLDAVESRVHTVLAGLREETPHPTTTDLELMQMLDAAESLETRYTAMLRNLEAAQSHVVVPADPTGAEMSDLLTEFDDIGLAVFGPSPGLLAATAEGIKKAVDRAVDAVSDLAGLDSRANALELFRRLLGPAFDGIDAADRPGNLVNLQSYTTKFDFSGVKLLLAGDMQFTDPGSGNKEIKDAVGDLRNQVAADAPYSFVKLSHHGSDNAFNAEILDEMGSTRLFGICAGAHSSHHPDPQVLHLLNSRKEDLTWVRSDRNGLTSIHFDDGDFEIKKSTGEINDPRPNEVDAPAIPEVPSLGAGIVEPGQQSTPPPPTRASAPSEYVEVTTRVPHVQTTVRVTIEVDPPANHAQPDRVGGDSHLAAGDLSLGGGRQLPKLLFATNIDALAGNIGGAEATAAVTAVRNAGQPIVEMPQPSSDPAAALAAMRSALSANSDVAGVVLLGGYNVVPSIRLDCIPSELRRSLGPTGDPDDFVVWSDDAYGNADEDPLPDIPVSRIPDGRDSHLFRVSLSAGPSQSGGSRSGIRNVRRPFAAEIFETISGEQEFLVSEPYVFRPGNFGGVDGSLVYFMLHGDWNDSSRFWGEDTGGVEAVNVGNIPPDMSGAVVFAGCCWGALSVDTPASKVVLNRPFGQKSPNASIALSVLRRGALAYIGCTGAHYSPVEEPYEYFGGPMHKAFWARLASGRSPAQALFDAKAEFAINMPHGLRRPLEVAVEFKTLRQFSCLGLGW